MLTQGGDELRNERFVAGRLRADAHSMYIRINRLLCNLLWGLQGGAKPEQAREKKGGLRTEMMSGSGGGACEDMRKEGDVS